MLEESQGLSPFPFLLRRGLRHLTCTGCFIAAHGRFFADAQPSDRGVKFTVCPEQRRCFRAAKIKSKRHQQLTLPVPTQAGGSEPGSPSLCQQPPPAPVSRERPLAVPSPGPGPAALQPGTPSIPLYSELRRALGSLQYCVGVAFQKKHKNTRIVLQSNLFSAILARKGLNDPLAPLQNPAGSLISPAKGQRKPQTK